MSSSERSLPNRCGYCDAMIGGYESYCDSECDHAAQGYRAQTGNVVAYLNRIGLHVEAGIIERGDHVPA